MINRFLGRLRRFFFPPPGASRWMKILPFATLGILTLGFFATGTYTWEYTNSSEFCGTACHTMPPEYTAYLVSPHARIKCVECHIGRGYLATQLTRKAGDLKHVIFTITKKYEYPITADEMRPARETCERCHSPDKFSDDSLREIKHYGEDPQNTPTSIYLILKTGGGSKRLGLGRGIHWHIENKILYYPVDKREQSIPYVRVYQDDGTVEEFIDLDANLDPESIPEASLREMDCITCHNRITHIVPMPGAQVDRAIGQHMIDPSIPEIRQKGVEVLQAAYPTKELALNGIAGLSHYYQQYYPEEYADLRPAIERAIQTLQEIYTQSVFLDQKSDWSTHPNNVGHQDSPGCFRCHDGKHVNGNQEAIRLECNLCHSIPVVADSADFVTDIEISRGPEPETHLSTTWIAQHRFAFDDTCGRCHDTTNPGGTDNISFCSNSACHGNVWTYAGFDAPKLRDLLSSQLPPTPTPEPVQPASEEPNYHRDIQPLLKQRCGGCHGEGGIQGLNLTTYQGILAGGANGPVLTPGHAETSLLVQKQSGKQPHFGQLNTAELALLIQWINDGAPEQ